MAYVMLIAATACSIVTFLCGVLAGRAAERGNHYMTADSTIIGLAFGFIAGLMAFLAGLYMA